MIVVRLQGGLGNQMFQYALGRALSLNNKTDFCLEKSFKQNNIFGITQRQYALDVFNFEVRILEENTWHKISSFIKRVLQKLFKINFRGLEKGFFFDKSIIEETGGIYLDGYWQSYKYFEKFGEQIRADFFLKHIDSNLSVLAQEIENKKSVCIHIRRGDYVGNQKHEVVGLSYYHQAIELLKNKMEIEKFYVFSDDITWCKNNLKLPNDAMFVSDEYAGKNGEGHIFLMSKCKGFIIPNSTFSWWGAWLSGRENKVVVAPKIWRNDIEINTDDLIPNNWIII